MTKQMDLNEFRLSGLLQEANRQFFHPLGLALGIEFDGDGLATSLFLLDQRDDSEGTIYDWDGCTDALAKAASVQQMMQDKADHRLESLGYIIQPLPEAKE